MEKLILYLMMSTRLFGLCGSRRFTIMKKISVLNLIFLIIILVGCNPDVSKEGGEVDFHTSKTREESEYCKEILDEVIRCLDEDDADTLKSLFSEYIDSKCDLERQIDKAMEAYDGESVSYAEYGCERGSRNVHNGYYSLKYASVAYRDVIMDSGAEYYIHVVICLVDDENPENLGVTRIEISDANYISTEIAEIGD